MVARLVKIGIVAIEVLGVVLAVGAAGCGYLFWSLEQGPINLDWMRKTATTALQSQLPDKQRASIGDIYLSKDKSDGAYNLTLINLRVAEKNGAQVFDFENATLSISSTEILNGKFRPAVILLDGLSIELKRDKNNTYVFDNGSATKPAARTKRSPSVLATIIKSNAYFNDVFKIAKLENVTLVFGDESVDRQWVSDKASATLERTSSGIEAKLNAQFQSSQRSAQVKLLANIDENSEMLTASIDVENGSVADLFELFLGTRAVGLDAVVSGSAELKMAGDGKIVYSSLQGKSGAGKFNLGNGVTDLKALDFQGHFSAESNDIELKHFNFDSDRGRGVLTGRIDLDPKTSSSDAAQFAFHILSENFTLGKNGLFPQEIDFEKIDVVGTYDLGKRRLDLKQIETEFLDVGLTGAFSLERPPGIENQAVPSPAVVADLVITGTMVPDEILQIWPVTLGLGARDFLRDRITNGTISNIQAKLDVGIGDIDREGGLPDDALAMTFDVANASVIYAPGMTPLKNVWAKGLLRGNSFDLTASSAKVGNIAVKKGSAEFTAFRPKGAPSYFRFEADGSVTDMLKLLDQKPLSVLQPVGMSPEKFLGRASANIEIMRPNRRVMPRHRYRYNGEISFDQLKMANVLPDIDFTGGKGTIDLETKGMVVKGTGLLSETPIEILWDQKFFEESDGTKIEIGGVANSSTTDLFGMPTRQFLRGDVAFKAYAKGQLANLDKISIEADFSEALMLLEPLGWAKPKGAPALGSISLLRTSDTVDFQRISLNGQGIDVLGKLSLTSAGVLSSAAFEKLNFENVSDISATLGRSTSNMIEVMVSGAYLNIGRFVETAAVGSSDINQGPFDVATVNWGDGISVGGRIDKLELRNQSIFTDAKLSFLRSPTELENLSVSANGLNETSVSIDLKTRKNLDAPKYVEALTDDIGTLVSGLFGMKSVKGGQGVIEFSIHKDRRSPDDTSQFGRLIGAIKAENMKIVGAPLLAKIFAAGSFDALGALLNDEGIKLTQASTKFAFQNDAIIIRDLTAVGPAIGLSMDGRVAGKAGGGVDLNGAVAPVYQVNSFLGKTPLIGDLLVNKKGEGVVALSYKVRGPTTGPTISVNPLSALTPGFLRRIFEPERDSIDEIMQDNPVSDPEGLDAVR